MPKIGDRACASEIGYRGTHHYIYYPCPTCGEARWLQKKQIDKYRGQCVTCAGLRRRGEPRYSIRGDKNPAWKGGRILVAGGYIRTPIYPEDPFISMAIWDGRNHKYHIFEHRYVMAKHLGRPLESWEVVHHINGDRADNRIENLEILPNKQTHMAFTLLQQENTALKERVAELEGRVTILEAQRVLEETQTLEKSKVS